MRLRVILPLLLTILLSPALSRGQGSTVYDLIGPMPPLHSQAQVHMEEFANFTCPHCNNFRLASKQLREKYGKRLQVTLVPIAFRGQPDTPLRLYFIAERAGRGEEIKTLIFDAAFRYGVNVYDAKIVSYLARSAGLADVYEQEATADWVSDKVKQAHQRADQIGLEGTPTIVLNGALRLVPRTGMQAFVTGLDQTIADLLKP